MAEGQFCSLLGAQGFVFLSESRSAVGSVATKVLGQDACVLGNVGLHFYF